VWGSDRPRRSLADIEVLTEDTLEIAVREEDRSRSTLAPQTILFAEVSEVARHDGVAAGNAHRLSVREAVDIAVAGTDPAGTK
jgi:hypothetical protein